MIRKALPSDHPLILEIWEHSVKASHDFLPEAYFNEIKRVLPGILPVMELALFELDGSPAGFLGSAGEKIEMLFVEPSQTGKGIGAGLMNYALKELGCTEVDVNEQNPKALAFYQRMGFKITKRSELDGMGKPFPVLHLARENRTAGHDADRIA